MRSDLIQLILNKVEAETKQEHTRHHTLGVYRASEIGGCPRALQYATLKYPAEQISPELMLLFQDGHLHHHAVRTLMARVGTLSHVERTVSKKYKHNGASFTVTGTLDGMWNDMPFDIKSITTFKFVSLDKNFPDDYARYVDQLLIYLDILDKPLGFILFKNKNDSELKLKYVKFNQFRFKAILDRLAQVHMGAKKKKLLPRPYAATNYLCKTCAYRMQCWNLPMESKRWKRSQAAIEPRTQTLRGALRESIKRGGSLNPDGS